MEVPPDVEPVGGDHVGLALDQELRLLPRDVRHRREDVRKVRAGTLDAVPEVNVQTSERVLEKNPTSLLGCASACRESFRVFTFRTCFINQPAGPYAYCQGKARYSWSIFRKISPYKPMRNPVACLGFQLMFCKWLMSKANYRLGTVSLIDSWLWERGKGRNSEAIAQSTSPNEDAVTQTNAFFFLR